MFECDNVEYNIFADIGLKETKDKKFQRVTSSTHLIIVLVLLNIKTLVGMLLIIFQLSAKSEFFLDICGAKNEVSG